LNAASDNVADVLLNWTGSVSATSYNIRRSTNNGLAYTLIGTTSMKTFMDTNTVSGTSYYYVVSALNSNGESSNFSPASCQAILRHEQPGLSNCHAGGNASRRLALE
jgi:cellulose 1,4-beta-cellobiosidase